MINLMIQKSAPDTSDFLIFILILFAFLFILLILNNLIDWLRTRPWKRNIPPIEGSSEEDDGEMNIRGKNKTEIYNNCNIDGEILIKPAK